MKRLIYLLFLSGYGCLPTDGGYYPAYQGALPADQEFLDDYYYLQNYFSQFELKTPTTDYSTMNAFFSNPSNVVSPSTATVEFFMENGLSQNLMFSPNPQGLSGKTVDFDLNSLVIQKIFYLSPPPYIPIDPPPENNIPVGSIILVSINSNINGAPSNYFQDMYLLKTQNGQFYWYVWYGNQNPTYTP